MTWLRLTYASSFSPTAQCPAENCNGDRAYFFQLQIRSADEPMTTFLKVGGFTSSCGRLASNSHTDSVVNSVPAAVLDGEKTEVSRRETIIFNISMINVF